MSVPPCALPGTTAGGKRRSLSPAAAKGGGAGGLDR